ncbi:WD40-repeat-containing domain [Pseudocohnilembus persalinus]|uniref:WD40-repeat-containing domain n=1 Tax=Pseudocohnilembus persalinus TaxID=266149 RepID=A0A0V0R8Y8_PSEPJ|nr:WD40-repeat-containing domain [Pseudocohnilembus persalinus]|eukprot:KRX10945.1 WD40-repeat-containing domain [Pseudocohnilembus persalinus]
MMNFTDLVEGTQLGVYSPNSQYFAVSNSSLILIKNVDDTSTVQKFSMPDTVTHMEFSPDSSMILAIMPKSAQLAVYSVLEGSTILQVQEQSCGIAHAIWAPNRYSFSNDGKFMALVERKEAKDYVGIYFTNDWKLINHFQVETNDLSDIAWTNNNYYIIVWDTPLNYKLLAYCPAQGKKATIQPYNYALGIKTVKLSNDAQYLAIGSYDEKVRLVNTLTWNIIIELEHKSNLQHYNSDFAIYNETLKNSYQNLGKQVSEYKIVNQLKLKTERVITSKPDQPQGIDQIQWSHNNNFLATKSSNMPNTIWIWDVAKLELKYVLNHINPVTSFSWSPLYPIMAISSGQNKFFFFKLDHASSCQPPFEGKPLQISNITWAQNSKSILLQGRKEVFIGYLPQDLLGNEENQNSVSYQNDQQVYNQNNGSLNQQQQIQENENIQKQQENQQQYFNNDINNFHNQ